MNNLETRIASLEKSIKPVKQMPALIFGFIEDDGSETHYCIIHPFRKTVYLACPELDEEGKPRMTIFD